MIRRALVTRSKHVPLDTLRICTPQNASKFNRLVGATRIQRYTYWKGATNQELTGQFIRPSAGEPIAGREKVGLRHYGGHVFTLNRVNFSNKAISPRKGGKDHLAGDDPQQKKSFHMFGLAVVYWGACAIWVYFHVEPVPITGRWQFRIGSEHFAGLVELGEERTPGQQDWLRDQRDFFGLENTCLPDDDPVVIQVKRVLDRLLQASGLDRYQWDVQVFDRPGIARVVVDCIGNTLLYKQIGEHIRRDANGVKQVAFIGVTNPLDPQVETADDVAADLVEAGKYIAKDQLGATDDCGFSPFSIDIKPKHGSPDFARDVAMQKIKARIEGARLASEKLGI